MKPRKGHCRHGLQICSTCVVVTDAAKRMADTINLKVISFPWDVLCNGYMAFALADGTSDNVVYDNHRNAARFNDAKRYAFFCFRSGMGGATPHDCQIFLDLNRHAAEAGIPMAEPELAQQPAIIMSTYGHDVITGKIDP